MDLCRHLFAISLVFSLSQVSLLAQSGIQPSRTSDAFSDLRDHARNRLIEQDKIAAEKATNVEDITDADESGFPLSDAANAIRSQYYSEAQNGASSEPGAQSAGSLDQIYQRRLASRRAGTDQQSSFASADSRYGAPQTGYSYTQQARPNYFPTTTAPEDRNFSLGPMDVRIGARLYSEYNDNIRSSSSQSIEDVVVGTMWNIGGTWQLTEGNRIDLNLGLGIERYLQHQDDIATSNDEFNLIVSPDSAFSFDFFIGNMLVNIHDRLSIQHRGNDDFTLDDLEFFSQWQNTAGISAYLPLNEEVDVSMSYDFLTVRSLEDRSEYLDRNTHQIAASTSYSPGQFWRVGLETSTSFNRYTLPVQNDSEFYSAGIFFESPITEFTDFRIDGGYQVSDFSNTGAGATSGNGGDYYASLEINNTLNTYFSHGVSLGHETNLGVLSDTSTVDFLRYSFSIDTKRDQTIGGSVYYEKEEEAGGTFQEDSKRYGASLTYSISLSEDLTARVSGSYSKTDSELGQRAYERWNTSVGLDYTLSEKLALGLAYSHADTSTETGVQDYKQNRVTLDLNYRF